MALTKNKNNTKEKQVIFLDHIEAQVIFKDKLKSTNERVLALEFLIENQTISHMLKLTNMVFSENEVSEHIFIDMIFNSFHKKTKTNEDYDEFLKSLQSTNVYLRNMAIKYLQESNEEATLFIEKILNSKDRDIRIFALNVLGDIKYEKSVDLLRYFLVQENDINAIMTAVDYLGEVGNHEDLSLLEALKKEHQNNAYVVFGVDMAISRIKG